MAVGSLVGGAGAAGKGFADIPSGDEVARRGGVRGQLGRDADAQDFHASHIRDGLLREEPDLGHADRGGDVGHDDFARRLAGVGIEAGGDINRDDQVVL